MLCSLARIGIATPHPDTREFYQSYENRVTRFHRNVCSVDKSIRNTVKKETKKKKGKNMHILRMRA